MHLNFRLFAVAWMLTLLSVAGRAEVAEAPASPAPAPAKPASVEAFSLIGTASYDGGQMAVFDGNRADFKTYLHVGERIADCTVTAIRFDRVRLRTPQGEVELFMEKQLRREGAGNWQVSELSERFTPREFATTSTAAAPGAVAISASPAPQSGGAGSPRGDRPPSDKELNKIDKKLLEVLKPGKDRKPSDRDGSKILKQVSKEMRRSS